MLTAVAYFFIFRIFSGKVPAYPQLTRDDISKYDGIYDSVLGRAYQDISPCNLQANSYTKLPFFLHDVSHFTPNYNQRKFCLLHFRDVSFYSVPVDLRWDSHNSVFLLRNIYTKTPQHLYGTGDKENVTFSSSVTSTFNLHFSCTGL